MLDDASFEALWGLYAATSIRPEYALPSLQIESGLRPDLQNLQGAPYFGINQAGSTWLRAHGIDPQDYLTWPASRQITEVVTPMWAANVAQGVVPASGTRVEQMNYLPATLKTATRLEDIVVSAGSPYYNKPLDLGAKGFITVGDLALFVKKAAASASVRSAIAAAYALKPSEHQEEPVYGTDFPVRAPVRPTPPRPAWPALAGAVVIVGSAAVGAYALRQAMRRSARRRRRAA